MIHPNANTPTAPRITANGVAIPAPLPEADSPAISGIRNAAENTGPMNPTDWAMASTSVRRLWPSRSYSACCDSVT